MKNDKQRHRVRLYGAPVVLVIGGMYHSCGIVFDQVMVDGYLIIFIFAAITIGVVFACFYGSDR